MSDFFITVIGTIAAIGTTASWLPQVVKTVRTRHADDFSWGYLALFSFGVATWAVYGFLRHDVVVIGANVITLCLLVPILVTKAH